MPAILVYINSPIDNVAMTQILTDNCTKSMSLPFRGEITGEDANNL